MLICGVHTAPGLALVRSVTLECADRSFSWLPAGPPIGSGRSSDTARALVLRIRARRRRTSSRDQDASRTRPSSERGAAECKCGLERGDKPAPFSVSCPRTRHPVNSEDRNSGTEIVPGLVRDNRGQWLLDSRFRGNDSDGTIPSPQRYPEPLRSSCRPHGNRHRCAGSRQ
jgi:hypothetical protein